MILRRFRRDRSGASALEFALLAPVFLLILAGVVDIGSLLHTKYRLNSAIAAGSNYALVNGQDISEDEGADLALNIARVLAGEQASASGSSTVVVNNAEQVQMTGGVATTSSLPGNGDACYCPTKTDGSVAWGSAATCGSVCAGGGVAGKFVLISISKPYAPMFGGYGFTESDQITVSAVVQGQ
ncbi:MAG: pilus assembly protein [Rhizobiaceae bacterium]|nr:pilus assembly protein [Rhizobiaceae bacterium]